MSKRAKHPTGFHGTFVTDVCDRGNTDLKYRPKKKPSVVGFYEVERIVAKRIQARKAQYYIQWKNHSAIDNTWVPAEQLPEDLVTNFESRYVDPVRADECRERLALLFEKGLKSPLSCIKTITMRHGVLRSLFPDIPLQLRETPFLASREALTRAGLGSFLKKCLTVTGGGCMVDTPVRVKLFLGRSPTFRDEQGQKTACRPVEKVQIEFTKSYFTGNSLP